MRSVLTLLASALFLAIVPCATADYYYAGAYWDDAQNDAYWNCTGMIGCNFVYNVTIDRSTASSFVAEYICIRARDIYDPIENSVDSGRVDKGRNAVRRHWRGS